MVDLAVHDMAAGGGSLVGSGGAWRRWKRAGGLDHLEFPIEEPELMAAALSVANACIFGGVSGLGRRIGLQPKTLKIVTGLDFSEDLEDDPKVVRLYS